jgi:hypothetical protein
MRVMKISVTKEIYWTVGTAIVTGIIGLLLFNGRLWGGQPIEVQLHDTYLVFSKQSMLAIIFLILLTGCYLTRTIYYKLDNKIVIGLLTFLLVALLIWQFVYLEFVNGLEYHIAPVVDKGDYFQKQDVRGFKELRGFIWTLIFATGTILATVGIKLFKTKRLS